MDTTTAARRNAGITQEGEKAWVGYDPGQPGEDATVVSEHMPRGNLGGLIDSTEKDMQRLIGVSVADCRSSLECSLARHPADTLRTVTRVLHLMNFRDIEKKTHRRALVRAGKKALAKIGEFQGERS